MTGETAGGREATSSLPAWMAETAAGREATSSLPPPPQQQRKQSGDDDDDEDDEEEEPEPPKVPIVRLKVEFTGFSTINLQRFGAQFTSKVANPDELLQFFRKKTPGVSKKASKADGEVMDDSILEGDDGEEDMGLFLQLYFPSCVLVHS